MVKFLQLIGVLDELSLFTISAMTLVASLAVVIFDLTSYEGEGSVKHPDHVDDFTSAYAWVLENIGRYDGDTNNIFLMGHRYAELTLCRKNRLRIFVVLSDS